MWTARRRRLNSAFAMGSNYFFQIAKLRAFRMVWARAVESFGGTARSGARAHRCTHVAVEQDRLRSAPEYFARDDRGDGCGAWWSGLGDGVAVRRVLQGAQ